MHFQLESSDVFWIHFLLCAVLFYLMAQSRRLNAKLASPALKFDFAPITSRLPGKQAYAQSLLRKKLEMTQAAYGRRKIHGQSYQREKKYIAVIAALRCWLEIAMAFAWMTCKNIVWFLRKKLRCLPGSQTGMGVNVIVLWLMASFYKLLYDLFSYSSVFGLSLALSDERVMTITGQLKVYFCYASPLLLIGVGFLALTFLNNRELYFDFFGVEFLLFIAAYRLIVCSREQCCFGIPFPWGVYNNYKGTIVFPSQYFESATAFLGAVICVVYMLFAKSYRTGRGVILALLWYSVTRFIAEFFRYTGPDYRPNLAKDKLGLSSVHWACITAFVFAVAMWFLLPLEKKLLDAVSAKGKALWAKWKKWVASNAALQNWCKRVLMSCPKEFRRYYEVEQT